MTAVLPILAALEPVVAPLVIKLIDHLFPPKSGPVKLPVAVSTFQAILDGLVKAGQAAPGQVPDAETLKTWVQGIVDALNRAGELKGPATVIPQSTAPPFVPTVDSGAPSEVAQADARLILQILAGIAPAVGVKLG